MLWVSCNKNTLYGVKAGYGESPDSLARIDTEGGQGSNSKNPFPGAGFAPADFMVRLGVANTPSTPAKPSGISITRFPVAALPLYSLCNVYWQSVAQHYG